MVLEVADGLLLPIDTAHRLPGGDVFFGRGDDLGQVGIAVDETWVSYMGKGKFDSVLDEILHTMVKRGLGQR